MLKSNILSFLYDKYRDEKLNYEEVAADYLYLKLWEKAVKYGQLCGL